MQETWVRSLGWEDPLEKEKATHSGILAWRIPWTEEPGGLQSMRLQRVGHNSETKEQQSGSAGFLCAFCSLYPVFHAPHPRVKFFSVCEVYLCLLANFVHVGWVFMCAYF